MSTAKSARHSAAPNAQNHGCGLQCIRVVGLRFIGRIVICGRGKAQEFFFETDPDPYPYTAPQAKAGFVNKKARKFPTQKFRIAVRKAVSKVLRR
jgi:hypothetical protein